MNFSVIGSDFVRVELKDKVKIKSIISNAYMLHGNNESINPDSYFLRFPSEPNNRIIALPAHLKGDFNVSGLKWISSYPGNIQKGLPRASAVSILNDTETGFPIACIESSYISASRTAASAILAAELISLQLKNSPFRKVGIIGSGFLARTLFEHAIGNDWNISDLILYDLSATRAMGFAKFVESQNTEISISLTNKLYDVFRNPDLIIITTTALNPYISYEVVNNCSKTIILHISLRDIEPSVILNSDNIVDDIEHVLKANTSLHLTEQLCAGDRSFINGTLFDLQMRKPILSGDKNVIFSPFGLGILDLALAKYVYDQYLLKTEKPYNINFFSNEN